MDPITLKFTIRCALALAAIITVAVCCSRLEKRIENWQQNLKDIEL